MVQIRLAHLRSRLVMLPKLIRGDPVHAGKEWQAGLFVIWIQRRQQRFARSCGIGQKLLSRACSPLFVLTDISTSYNVDERTHQYNTQIAMIQWLPVDYWNSERSAILGHRAELCLPRCPASSNAFFTISSALCIGGCGTTIPSCHMIAKHKQLPPPWSASAYSSSLHFFLTARGSVFQGCWVSMAFMKVLIPPRLLDIGPRA